MAPTTRPFNEPLRPQFHFSPPTNWMNDPNGLLFDGSLYHLFYQHDPDSITQTPHMSWGHAVSRDLLHWEHWPIAIPNREPHHAWSGSALLDKTNVLGLQQEGNPTTIVAFYACIGEGQTLCASVDGGRTFGHYSVVLPHTRNRDQNPHRDPKVFYYAPPSGDPGHFVLVLWEDTGYAFYTSTNLRNWTKTSFVEHFFECPDLLEIPVEDAAGKPTGEKVWTLIDGTGQYVTGTFDGKTYLPASPKLTADHGPNYYATQTWANAPIPIQLAWMRADRYPNMPFNQQMTFPRKLSLRKYGKALKLHQNPIDALSTLVTETTTPKTLPIQLPELARITLSLANTAPTTLSIAGQTLTLHPAYHLATFNTRNAPTPCNDPVKLEILLDRPSLELFLADGHTTFSLAPLLTLPQDRTLTLLSGPEPTTVKIETLRSTWI